MSESTSDQGRGGGQIAKSNSEIAKNSKRCEKNNKMMWFFKVGSSWYKKYF